jgi:5-hydroxyisourate hydrolase-like protein (transthyretin family)
MAALVGLLLCSAAANASRASTVFKEPSTIKVKVVDHRGRPVSGAVIVVYVFGGHTKDHINEQQEFSRSRTNESGEVFIDKLAPRDYRIALNETVFADDFYAKVVKELKGQGELVFHWPPKERVIVTSTLSGMLHRWETTAGKNGIETVLNRTKGMGQTLPVSSTELTLFKLLSDEKVAEVRTDEDGRFDLKVAEAGFYYMRFHAGSSEETIVLELDRDFVGAAPVLDILVEDIILSSAPPLFRSLNGGMIQDSGAHQ